jgi:hypothetical protein
VTFFIAEDGYDDVRVYYTGYVEFIPLTLHKVLTILSALASDKKALSSAPPTLGSSFASPKDLLVTSATVPIPNPAAKPPNDTMRAIRDEGTFLCLAVTLSCKYMKHITSIHDREMLIESLLSRYL